MKCKIISGYNNTAGRRQVLKTESPYARPVSPPGGERSAWEQNLFLRPGGITKRSEVTWRKGISACSGNVPHFPRSAVAHHEEMGPFPLV
ncbi:MAG: hypothetical protein DRN08_07390, partial [Thermoplasmata archaeon]